MLDLSLCAYLEPLVSNRSVLWVDRSAPPPSVWADASVLRVLSKSLLDPAGLAELQGSSFDWIVVPDLDRANATRVDALIVLRRLLSDEGAIVAGMSASSGSLSYGALQDLFARGFDRIHMIGQAPMSGTILVDFGGGAEPAVSFDDTLLEAAPTPSRYYAVASRHDVALEPFAIIQTPTAALTSSSSAGTERAGSAMRARDTSAGREVAPARDTPAVREADLLALRTAEKAHRDLQAELEQRQSELDAQNEYSEGLEAELAKTKKALTAAESELNSARLSNERTRAEHATSLSRLVEEHHRALRNATAGLEEQQAAEVRALESHLSDAGRKIAELQADLAARTTFARDLIEQLRDIETRKPAIAVAATDDRAALLEQLAEAQANDIESRYRADETAGLIRELEERLGTAELRASEAEARASRASGGTGVGTGSTPLAASDAKSDTVIALLEEEVSGLRRGYTTRIRELELDFQAERAALAAAKLVEQSRATGLLLRLDDREIALASLAAIGFSSEAASDLAELRRARDKALNQVADAEERLVVQTAKASHLAATAASKESVIARLERELTDRSDTAQHHASRLRELETEAHALRRSLSEVGAKEEDRQALATRVRELETSLRKAEEQKTRSDAARESVANILAETRAILLDAREGLARIEGEEPRSGTIAVES